MCVHVLNVAALPFMHFLAETQIVKKYCRTLLLNEHKM